MHPPSPKAMEDRGIMGGVVLVARLKASRSARRLDASQDIRPALHDVGGVLLRWQSNSKLVIQSEAKDPEFIVATNKLSTLFREIDEWN